jgi:hypothetical protein
MYLYKQNKFFGAVYLLLAFMYLGQCIYRYCIRLNIILETVNISILGTYNLLIKNSFTL